MIALDTNLLVRVMTRDDPEQAEAAAAVLRGGALFVAKTVLLETEWVLRFSYAFPPEAVAEALGRLLGLRGLEVEDRGAVERALRWHRDGMDFADALHLASSPEAVTSLATFDRRLAAAADRPGAAPSVRLVGAPA